MNIINNAILFGRIKQLYYMIDDLNISKEKKKYASDLYDRAVNLFNDENYPDNLKYEFLYEYFIELKQEYEFLLKNI